MNKKWYLTNSVWKQGMMIFVLGVLSQFSGHGLEFYPHVDYPTGNNARAVAVGDLDGDGGLDLAVANRADASMSILLNQGDGTFSPKVDYPAQTTPHSVCMALLDTNASLDVLIANRDSDTLSIYFNFGNGTFPANLRTNLQTGDGPRAVNAADFDEDGDEDLVVANTFANTMSVFTNDGVGLFTLKTNYSTGVGGSEPCFFVVAPFNNDTHQDVVLANAGTDLVNVFTNDGAANFNQRDDYAVGDQPRAIAAGDFNGDTFPDLVTMNVALGSISILTNDGNGLFSLVTNYPTQSGGTVAGVATDDLDNDGDTDIVASNFAASSLSLFLNDGLGSFVLLTNLPSGAAPSAVALADLNGDNKMDMVSANWNGNSVSIFLQTNKPFITSAAFATGYVGVAFQYIITALGMPTNFDAIGLPSGLAISNVTGVIYGTPTLAGTNLIKIIASNPQGHDTNDLTLFIFSTNNLTATNQPIYRPADFTGDGIPDLLVQKRKRSIGIMPLTLDLTGAVRALSPELSLPTEILPGNQLPRKTRLVAAGDVNRDGIIDILTSSNRTFRTFLLNSNLSVIQTLSQSSPTRQQIIGLGDLIGNDAYPDLIVKKGTSIRIFQNLTNQFSSTAISLNGRVKGELIGVQSNRFIVSKGRRVRSFTLIGTNIQSAVDLGQLPKGYQGKLVLDLNTNGVPDLVTAKKRTQMGYLPSLDNGLSSSPLSIVTNAPGSVLIGPK